MSVTLAPELAEAIKESAERQGLSLDDWVVAAAELKFRADDEAAIFEEAEEKRRRAGLQEYLDEYQAEFGAFTEEELAESERRDRGGEADLRRVLRPEGGRGRMTALVLDAGALIAVDRGDRDMHDLIQDALRTGTPVRTNPNVVAQVWRNGARQARLARLFASQVADHREDGYRAGELWATRTKDVVDATVALLAKTGDRCTPAIRVTCEALRGDRLQGPGHPLLKAPAGRGQAGPGLPAPAGGKIVSSGNELCFSGVTDLWLGVGWVTSRGRKRATRSGSERRTYPRRR